MKAENILNSNLRRKSTVVYMFFFAKIGFSKIIAFILMKKKIFEHKNDDH